MPLKSHVENLHRREDSGRMAVVAVQFLISSNPHVKEQNM